MEKKGFTIIEILVVIGIIAFLATIVMGGSHYAKVYANQTKAESDVATIAKAIDTLALDTRQWPGHQTVYVACSGSCDNNEIANLFLPSSGLKSTDGSFPNWNGPYMQVLTMDPWGNNYFMDTDYEIDGETKAVVGSYGPNGVGLNQYDGDDIVQVISR